MKHFLITLFVIVVATCFGGCSVVQENPPANTLPSNEIIDKGFDFMLADQLLVKIGDNALVIQLEDNPTTQAIKAWLNKEEKTVSASNYGGFEKILSLGKSFPTDNRQITTSYGDVMLYNGNQLVIFYNSNTWSYTKVGKVVETEKDLATILSGNEKEAKISLVRGTL